MAEYYDLGMNLNAMFTSLGENNIEVSKYVNRYVPGFAEPETIQEDNQKPITRNKIRPLDTTFLEARNSICVVGRDQEAVIQTKGRLASLVDGPLPLESFHVKQPSDLCEGALLVPKVVLVASHSPGVKVIDEDGNSGQLDFIYDQVCEVGADLMVIYVGLPRIIYPPTRHMVYHPRMADLVFPSQPILGALAQDHCLITLVEHSDLTSMQKNVIREWLAAPVGDDHPVFKAASVLSAVEYTFSEAEFWSESELYRYKRPQPYHDAPLKYLSATEEHPLADKAERRRKKKKKKYPKSSTKKQTSLIELSEEQDEDLIELDAYNASGLDTEIILSSSIGV